MNKENVACICNGYHSPIKLVISSIYINTDATEEHCEMMRVRCVKTNTPVLIYAWKLNS